MTQLQRPMDNEYLKVALTYKVGVDEQCDDEVECNRSPDADVVEQRPVCCVHSDLAVHDQHLQPS